MIVGYHIVFGAYGFWLPNDPRGSWSEFVGSWALFRYGGATKTTARRSLAHRAHDHVLRRAAKQALQRPAVRLTGLQARAVGRGMGTYLAKTHVQAWACAVLPDHVHLVVGRPKMAVEQLVIQLKGAATKSLKENGLHPFGGMLDDRGRTPKCFSRGEWKVFLEPNDVPRAIRYVEENPPKEGKPPQRWSFVTRFEERSAFGRG